MIIEINDYKGPKIPNLETATNDATAIARVLKEKYGFQVKLLLDREANKEAIYRELRRITSGPLQYGTEAMDNAFILTR